MPSSLTGLFLALDWKLFPTRKASPPGPGKSATAARTGVQFNRTRSQFQPISGTRPAQFELVDNVQVSVTFDPKNSFVFSWVFSRPQQFQNDMLNHEQGHYNITALVVRDFFVDVMMLKSRTFGTRQDGLNAVTQILGQSLNKLQKVHNLYDSEVHPEQDSGQSRGPVQQSWDAFIGTAFTQARASGTIGVGTVHKTRLIEILQQNQKKI